MRDVSLHTSRLIKACKFGDSHVRSRELPWWVHKPNLDHVCEGIEFDRGLKSEVLMQRKVNGVRSISVVSSFN